MGRKKRISRKIKNERNPLLEGPKAFPRARLLAIFDVLWRGAFGNKGTTVIDIPEQLTLLNKLDLLCYVNDDMSDRRLICKISYHFAFNLARSVNVSLEDYLAHESGNKAIRL